MTEIGYEIHLFKMHKFIGHGSAHGDCYQMVSEGGPSEFKDIIQHCEKFNPRNHGNIQLGGSGEEIVCVCQLL